VWEHSVSGSFFIGRASGHQDETAEALLVLTPYMDEVMVFFNLMRCLFPSIIQAQLYLQYRDEQGRHQAYGSKTGNPRMLTRTQLAFHPRSGFFTSERSAAGICGRCMDEFLFKCRLARHFEMYYYILSNAA